MPTQHNISRLHPSSDSGIFYLAIHYHSVDFDHYALTNDMNREMLEDWTIIVSI
jgi:hypothetical protein